MSSVTLKQLRYFEAVYQFEHFGRAANACSISQPALSMQIKELEIAIGAVLIERTARQIRLTNFGEDFAKKAREILRSVDDLEDLARVRNSKFPAKLRIGIIPTIAPYLLPRFIEGLTKAAPEIDLRVRETQTKKLCQELEEGKLDAAILALPVGETSLSEVALFEEEFVLVRPKKDAQNLVPDIGDLGAMKLLLLEEGHCFRDQALSFCNMDEAKLSGLLDGSSLSTLVQMVGSGMGVTLIPQMAIDIETKSAEVSTARFTTSTPKRTIGMVWRNTNPMHDQLLLVSDILGELAP
ncbi:MAG: LysR substrate-binding domain-containing protein [Nitratireductor sp.]